MCNYKKCTNPSDVTLLDKRLCTKHFSQHCTEIQKVKGGVPTGEYITSGSGNKYEILRRKPCKMDKELFTNKQLRECFAVDI